MTKEEISQYKEKYPKIFDMFSKVDEEIEEDIANLLAQLDEQSREDIYVTLISAIFTAKLTAGLSQAVLGGFMEAFGPNEQPGNPNSGTPTA